MLAFEIILHPTDFSERSKCAFDLACSLARDHGARLVVLHVASPPIIAFGNGVPVHDQLVDNRLPLEKRLREIQPSDSGLQIEHRLERGAPAERIIRVAHETGCDLIVMGTHGRTGLGRMLMGSVAEEVLRKATCPVLTVKAMPAKVELAARPGVEMLGTGI